MQFVGGSGVILNVSSRNIGTYLKIWGSPANIQSPGGVVFCRKQIIYFNRNRLRAENVKFCHILYRAVIKVNYLFQAEFAQNYLFQKLNDGPL